MPFVAKGALHIDVCAIETMLPADYILCAPLSLDLQSLSYSLFVLTGPT